MNKIKYSNVNTTIITGSYQLLKTTDDGQGLKVQYKKHFRFGKTLKTSNLICIRPDIFCFSSFKNPDRIFSRNGTKMIFLLPTVWKLCWILKKKKQTEYETIFYYAEYAFREKKTLNPNFDYTCVNNSVLLHQ